MVTHKKPLKILFIASEADPFIKVGGLGDVAGSLPRALHHLSASGHDNGKPPIDIRLAIPYHNQVRIAGSDLKLAASFSIQHQNGPIQTDCFEVDWNGLPVYLVAGAPFSQESPVYSADNLADGHKYTFFSLACLELSRATGWKPDLLHANDWHTSPAVYALTTLYKQDAFFQGVSSMLSIHNLPYSGVGAGPAMAGFGLPPASDSPLPWWAKNLPLALGLLAADHIVAVSPTYAREIMTPEYGAGLYDFFQRRADSITGILNGIDLERWNPETDPHIFRNYGPSCLEERPANKAALQQALGLEQDPHAFLMGMITRMDNQKGVDITLQMLDELAGTKDPDGQRWQAILLGTGLPELEENARQVERAYPANVRVVLRFDPPLSRQIYAGADALLLPSRYEPCGLAQMIAMRYGCVPVARATGGMRDTITDHEFNSAGDTQPTGSFSTGFLFSAPNPPYLTAAVRRAMAVYAHPPAWRQLQQEGMKQDFSWDRPARQYLELYYRLAASKSPEDSKVG